MLTKLHNEWRSAIIFILLVMLVMALFASRALLSALTISFIVFSFLHNDIRAQFRVFFSNPVLWGMSLLFVVPLVSGIWSEDKQQWLSILRIKLPLLLLPLAFAAPFTLSPRHWEWLAQAFILTITIATTWSMFHYVSDMAAINASYLKAKMIVTPLGNDHVRFSWLVSAAVLLAGWLFVQKRKNGHILAWLLIAVIVWLIIFLHILAARTGLFSFYIMVAGVVIWMIVKNRNRKQALALTALLVALPVLAYFLLPSFQNRVKYIRYDFGYFREAHYLPGANDAVRVISWKTGWQVLQQHPVAGVGFGDIAKEVNERYDHHYPGMIATDKILPGNEWLLYGSGSGWPGILLFTVVMCIPFFTKTRHRLLWWLLHLTLAFSFVVDIGLEVQFGVFVYSFMVCWWWKWLR